jgi:ComF family protein
MTTRLWSRLLSTVVPPLCAVCREPELDGCPLCLDCASRLVPLREPRCRRCGAPLPPNAGRCRECLRRTLAFDHAWSAFAYEGIARELVATLKTRGVFVLASFMAAEIAARAPADLFAGTLIPVPAHGRRRRRHGFNQAGEIAAALGSDVSVPVRDVLRRTRAPAQVGLERRARLESAHGSVRVKPGFAAPARAVLVDDVYTTGATLDACGQALREAGAREVVAVTFARALRASA